MIRQITTKERSAAGNIYCDWCNPIKVDAIWRQTGLCACHEQGDYACGDHKHLIQTIDEDDYMSEADYQTWGKL